MLFDLLLERYRDVAPRPHKRLSLKRTLPLLCALGLLLLLSLLPAFAGAVQAQEVETPTPLPIPTLIVEPPPPPPQPVPDTPTQEPPVEVPAPLPTDTPAPTHTAVPTNTPVPTHTPPATSTATSIPTDTPIPTATGTETETGTPTPSWFPPGPECYNTKPGKTLARLDVPYVHQVLDIGAGDGNWACGPTSAVMVLAYYGMLEPWETYVSRQAPNGEALAAPVTPTAQAAGQVDSRRAGGVTSGFGPYVSNVYTNNGRTYNATARDPRGNEVAGLYGTICPTGLADWGRMIAVLEWHGLSSKRIGAGWDSIVAALKRGHPVLLGNRLTPPGHVMVAIGYTDNRHLIVNDPYGNRFAPGYGGTGGKALFYPWDCSRVQNAVEVIGTYPPPPTVTSTPTISPTPTQTSVVPTATFSASSPGRWERPSFDWEAAPAPERAIFPTSRGALYETDSFGPRVPFRPGATAPVSGPASERARQLAASALNETNRVLGWWRLPAPAVLSMLALPVMLAGLVLFRGPGQRRPRSQAPTTPCETETEDQPES